MGAVTHVPALTWDTHVPLGGGRRPGRGDREPLNPPAPGLSLLLLLPFLHPPPAASKGGGGGGRKGHKLGLLVPSAGLYWENWEDWGAPSLAVSAEQPSLTSHVGVWGVSWWGRCVFCRILHYFHPNRASGTGEGLGLGWG